MNSGKLWSFAKEKLLLIGVALVVIIVGGAAFLIAEVRAISPVWVFAGGFAIIFVASVGKTFREKFSSRGFVLFFAAWVMLHVVISLLLLAYVPLVYWFIVYSVELAVVYILAVRLFGPIRPNL